MLFTVDLHEDFIDEESVAIALMLALQAPGIFGSELDAPEPDGFITDSDATFGQEVFDIAVAEAESVVKPDRVTDDIWWKPVTFVCIHYRIIYFRELS